MAPPPASPRQADRGANRRGERLTTANRLALAELLATRLCHDFGGPLGTICGALDVAAEDPAFAAEATALARQAATALALRLRLLRAAWGGAGEALTLAEFRTLARGAPADGVAVVLDRLEGPGPLAPEAGRLLLNLLLFAVESVHGRGTVAVSGDTAGEVRVVIDGPHAAWPPACAAWLADEAAAWAAIRGGAAAARRMQGPLTALIAHAARLRVTLAAPPETEAAGPPALLVGLGSATAARTAR